MTTQLTDSSQHALSPEELQAFRERGYAGPFTLCSPEEMAAFWRRVRLELYDRSMAIYGAGSGEGVVNISNYDRHLDNASLADHICRPEIVAKVCGMLGPDVLCWRTEFFPKEPGAEGTDWHQADTFASASGVPELVWPTNADFGGTVTVWTAFTGTNEETACLQFIPGTQREMYYDERKRMHYDPSRASHVDERGIKRGFFGYDYRVLQIDPNWKPDESASVTVPMKAGQFIIFWSTLMHASRPHLGRTKQMRLGYAARYVPSIVQVYPNTMSVTEYGGTISLEKYGVVLVSGKYEFGHNRVATHTTRGHPFRTMNTARDSYLDVPTRTNG